MRIGLDFDNTIVCYDQAIHSLSQKINGLPSDIERTKLGIKDFLKRSGRDTEWTRFQGELYGPGMAYARPFDGALATMHQLLKSDHQLFIISHRSRVPYAGPPYDLHLAARNWIEDHLNRSGLYFATEFNANVFFLESLHEKLNMINQKQCDLFLDDLPNVLSSSSFPDNTFPILFDPSRNDTSLEVLASWKHLPELISSLERL